MRNIPVDTTTIHFIHLGEIEQATTGDGELRFDAAGLALWKIPVTSISPGDKKPDGFIVTVPSASKPKLEQGVEVRFSDLRARHWQMEKSSGISFSASKVEAVRPKA